MASERIREKLYEYFDDIDVAKKWSMTVLRPIRDEDLSIREGIHLVDDFLTDRPPGRNGDVPLDTIPVHLIEGIIGELEKL